jgi:hypothetical protein
VTRFRLFALLLLVLPVLVFPLPASAATTVADCQAKITNLRAATLSATFVGQNAEKDQAGLVDKLDSATTKLDQGKFADALQALVQFRDKVSTLQAQHKIVAGDADPLIAAANDAIACVQNLQSGS